jgi:nitrate reductase NapE
VGGNREATVNTHVGANQQPASADELQSSRTRLEALAFAILAIFIWPFIAVGIVAGWGFAVWIYYSFTGPPGPV